MEKFQDSIRHIHTQCRQEESKELCKETKKKAMHANASMAGWELLNRLPPAFRNILFYVVHCARVGKKKHM